MSIASEKPEQNNSLISKPHLVLITGMSGAGKASTVRIAEDLGFFVIDNIMPEALLTVVDQATEVNFKKIAVVTDARTGERFVNYLRVVKTLKARDLRTELLFLDASDAVLIQRFKESRRPHPVASHIGGILPSIEAERELLEPARLAADKIIDTSGLSVPDLRRTLQSLFAENDEHLQRLDITVTSFGFKNGMPLDADLVFDVRFLRNPYWVPELRPLNGTMLQVKDFIFSDPDTRPLLAKLFDLIEFSLPRYEEEGKAYLTIGIGCTGGQHRSVTLAEVLAESLRAKNYRVSVLHRDMRENPAEVTQT